MKVIGIHRKAFKNLPLPVQHMIASVLSAARDTQPEESQKAALQFIALWGWLPILTSAIGLFSVAFAYTSSRSGATGVEVFFWLGLLLIFVPSVVRLLSASPSRFERISLLCVVGISLYLVNLMQSPLSFTVHDAFVHWRTAQDIAQTGHLFSGNSLLPSSPFYPGLEIVTNALSTVSGLSIFNAGMIVLGVARLLMILSLFLLYERITSSARIAGIATALYMTNPHFLFFDAQFSYESLAIPLATVVLLTLAYHESLKRHYRWITFTACIILAAVVVTHHITGFIFAGLLILWALMYKFQHPVRLSQSSLAQTAIFGVVASVAWINLQGNPVVQYLSTYFEGALNELGHILTGTSSARQLFVSYAGQSTPVWERIVAFSSVGLILLGLPFGLLCLWLRYRHNALAWTLGIVSIFYPVSQVFRFTNFGSEITDRAAATLFIAIACILAIFIAHFWPVQRLGRKQIALITGALTLVFLGGVILGAGPPPVLLPGPYLVAADARSIEPEGIQAALWMDSHLGPNNRISTDRINGLLMSTYGDQHVLTSLGDNVDVTPIFFSPGLSPAQVSVLKRVHVRYLVVDLRLGHALPTLGFYFDPREPNSFQHLFPISPEELTKFGTILYVNKVFESGNIVIYDIGEVISAIEKS